MNMLRDTAKVPPHTQAQHVQALNHAPERGNEMATGWPVLGIALLTTVVGAESAVPRKIVAAGCLNRVTHNGSAGGIAGGVPATPANADTLANTQEPTGAFILNGATTADPGEQTPEEGSPDRPRAYVLAGHAAELEAHVGHHVEVAGTLLPAADSAPASTRSNVKRIEVASLRMLAATCQAAPRKP